MSSRIVAAASALGLLVLAGCGADTEPASAPTATEAPSPTQSPTSGTPSPTPDPKPKGAVITTGESEFGTMLFDENEQAIYIWELEPTAEPACYDDCAQAWPPVLTKRKPVADGEVSPGLLGTTERRDGTTQVTYNDHPLYHYADEAPGEVKCHNVATHGGLWWVVQPGGDRAA